MDNKTSMDCLFYRNNPHVAYIDPADYIKPLFLDGVKISETKNSDGTYTITKDDYHMIVDPAKDTVYFDRYENFAFCEVSDTGERIYSVFRMRKICEWERRRG